jgi:hypothetical protein
MQVKPGVKHYRTSGYRWVVVRRLVDRALRRAMFVLSPESFRGHFSASSAERSIHLGLGNAFRIVGCLPPG